MIIPKKWKMLTKEHKLLEPFVKEPWKSFTFKEVKKLSKNKSNNYVHRCLKRFVGNGMLKFKRVGNGILYSLNDSVFALDTVGFIAEHLAEAAKHLPHENIQKVINKVKSAFFVFVVAGSYAKGKQKETSDIDVVIICDDERDPNSILSQIKLECELMMPEVHPYVFTEEQFYHMLTMKDENYGKEVARNNLIITGGKIYYAVLTRAIQHGFNG